MAVHVNALLAATLLFTSLINLVSSTSTFTISPRDGAATTINFALSIPENTNDLLFHFTAPSSNSWVGIGTGRIMDGSLMFIIYSSSDGKNVTLSPRIAPNHNEPQYHSEIQTTILDGTGVFNDTLVVNGRCSNCTTWATGSLDIKSTSSPWNYAIGTDYTMREDSPSATIQQHQQHGNFDFDLTQAVISSTTSVPTANPTASSAGSTGATLSGSPRSDIAWVPILHGIVASASFLLLMPLGVLFLRLFDKVRWHWVNQTLATILAIAAIVGGIYVSTTYTKASKFSSGHQIIGLIVLACVVLQVVLGAWHHMMFKRTEAKTVVSPIHRLFGPAVIILAFINGALGIDYAENDKYLPAYIVVGLVLLLTTAALLAWKRWSLNRKKKYATLNTSSESEWRGGQMDSDVQLGQPYRK